MNVFKILFLKLGLIFNLSAFGLTSNQCDEFVKSLPSDYVASTIKVPLDWNDPTSRSMTVFYFTNLKSTQVPVVYFNGGPLGFDHYSYKVFGEKAKERNLGFIYIDQRGTGCSEKLGSVVDLESAREASFLAADQIVLDAESIRKAILGDKPWKIFGQSYGGQIANRYLLMAGQSIISIHNYAGGFNSDMTQFFANRMTKQHEVATAFFARYPHLMSIFQVLKSSFSNDHCITYRGRSICGLVLLDMAMDELYSINNWPNFASSFSRLLENNQPNLTLIQALATYSLDYFFSDQFLMTHLVWRQEARSSSPSSFTNADCDNAELILKNAGLEPEELLVNHCRIVRLAMTPEITDFLADVVSKIEVRQPVIEVTDFVTALELHPDLIYYAYSGGLDFYDTMFRTYSEIKSPQFSHTHFLNQDHYGFFVELQFWDDLAR